MSDDYPSPFYALLDGAVSHTLSFPVDDDGYGPHWDASGLLVCEATAEASQEVVEVVELGDGWYRLAEKCDGPFSGLRLQWGDEFKTALRDGQLHMERVLSPQPYLHFTFLGDSLPDDTHPVAALVHKLRGGWESVAGGFLTLSIPVDARASFEAEMAVLAPSLNWLPLEA